MPFAKGQGGRRPGARNKRQPEVITWCTKLVEDATYRKGLQKRLNAGELPPGIEAMLWAYAYGKPTEHHEHSGEVSLPVRVVHEIHAD